MSDYWKYYHLSSDPFASDNPEVPPYISERWQQQLDLLTHLSETSNAILVVTGVLGVGKTVMMRHFVNQTKQESGICEVKGDLSISSAVLLQVLASHLAINHTEMEIADLKPAIIAALAKLQEQNKRYVLVIDNAHKLPESSLEFILEFANEEVQEAMSALHIVLFGGTQLTATIANITAEHMGEALTHTQRVEALNRQETAQYIEHRLGCVGVQSGNLLSEKDIDEIFKQSSGVPIKVNFFAKNTLIKYLPASETGLPRKTKMLKKHWPLAAAACALVVLVGALIITPRTNQELINDSANHASVKPMPAANVAQSNMAEQPSIDHQTYAAHGLLADQAKSEASQVMSLAVNNNAVAAQPQRVATAVATEAVSSQQANMVDAPKMLSQAKALQVAANPQPEAGAEQSKNLMSPAVIKNKQATEASLHESASVVAAKPKAVKHAVQTQHYGYTLQLLAAVTKSKADQFIASHDIQANAHVFHIRSRGKEWFVVTYGSYKNSLSARQAVHELPTKLQSQHPWIRSLASLTKDKVA